MQVLERLADCGCVGLCQLLEDTPYIANGTTSRSTRS